MHKLLWIAKRPDETYPFFYQAEAGVDYMEDVDRIKNENPNLWLDNRRGFPDPSNILEYRIGWEFPDEAHWLELQTKLLEAKTDWIDVRNNYFIEAGHELWLKIFYEDGRELLLRQIPLPDPALALNIYKP